MASASTHGSNYYVTFAKTGKVASYRGPKRFIMGLAAAISHKGMGTGKKTCVMKSGETKPVACFANGKRAKKS